jgi:hypothetical protein
MITLGDILREVENGKCKTVYYSTGNLWWTHSEDDLIQARTLGRAAMDKRNEDFLNDPLVPEKEKERLKGLLKLIGKNSPTPLDPTGFPLHMMNDPKEFMKARVQNGKVISTEDIIAVHHQNASPPYKNWTEYFLNKDKGSVDEINTCTV